MSLTTVASASSWSAASTSSRESPRFALLYPLLGHRISYIAVLVLVYAISIPVGFVLYRTLVFQVSGQWLVDLAGSPSYRPWPS